MAGRASQAGCRVGCAEIAAGTWAPTAFDAAAGAAGVPLDQRPGPATIWFGLRAVGTIGGLGPHGDRRAARQTQSDAAEAVATRLSARPGGDRALAARELSGHCTTGQNGRR